MSSVKVTTFLSGAEKLIRELKLADPRTRARVQGAVQRQTKAVLAASLARVPKKTQELASTGRDEYSKDGLTGFIKYGRGKLPRRSTAATAKGQKRAKGRSKATGKGAYAPVIDRGDPRRHIAARQFLTQPFAQHKPAVIADIDHALNESVKEIGS